MKLVATTLFVFFLVETLGRKLSLFISALGMGTLFFIIGALLKTFPPPASPPDGFKPPAASKAMAAMLYIYVCFYSMGWGPLPYVSTCSYPHLREVNRCFSLQMGLRLRHFPHPYTALRSRHR